ncbi:MAG: lasso peptide biosynthesis PqqD family chaperone [Gemmatimonadetes bacterium]|nr:lasso peptide biosynthesis PqqD family chaperone [Gemmatimonadota bacterium]
MVEPVQIGPATVVVQNTEPVSVSVDDTIVMMSLVQGKYYGLDRVGSRIWELMEHPLTVAELCAALCREFDVDEESCVRDVQEFLTDLANENLIRVVDETTGKTRASSAT